MPDSIDVAPTVNKPSPHFIRPGTPAGTHTPASAIELTGTVTRHQGPDSDQVYVVHHDEGKVYLETPLGLRYSSDTTAPILALPSPEKAAELTRQAGEAADRGYTVTKDAEGNDVITTLDKTVLVTPPKGQHYERQASGIFELRDDVVETDDAPDTDPNDAANYDLIEHTSKSGAVYYTTLDGKKVNNPDLAGKRIKSSTPGVQQ